MLDFNAEDLSDPLTIAKALFTSSRSTIYS